MEDDRSLAPYTTEAHPEQEPPPGYEPQVPLSNTDDVPGVYERASDLVDDAEAEDPDAQSEDDGDADDGDDQAQDHDDN